MVYKQGLQKVYHKTTTGVEMVHCVLQNHVCLHYNWWKNFTNKEGYHSTQQPWSTPFAFTMLWTHFHHPYIWQLFASPTPDSIYSSCSSPPWQCFSTLLCSTSNPLTLSSYTRHTTCCTSIHQFCKSPNCKSGLYRQASFKC